MPLKLVQLIHFDMNKHLLYPHHLQDGQAHSSIPKAFVCLRNRKIGEFLRPLYFWSTI